MNVLRDKNGVVCVPEHRKDMQRLPGVVDELTDQMFRETPTIAVSALISVLSRVLLVAGGDPINEARIVGEALKVFVRQHVEELRETGLVN